MGLSAGEVMARIHLKWCGKDDVKGNCVNFLVTGEKQEPFILPQSKCLIQVRCPEIFISVL